MNKQFRNKIPKKNRVVHNMNTNANVSILFQLGLSKNN